MALEPIIIRKKIKPRHTHHGGNWKLAYADFVTAMMAFFLLMWLLGATDGETRKGISEYFQDPYKASLIDKGLIPTLDEIAPTELDPQTDTTQLEKLKQRIQEMIDASDQLSEFKDQIKLETIEEGLRIQIIDNKNMPMFKLASSETEPEIRIILQALAPVINQLPNKITINGHTDAKPFPVKRKNYSNWELSGDRANAARRELNAGGLEKTKVLRITGLSDSIPYNPDDPEDPMNRRISIIVMNKKAEEHVFQEAGNNQDAQDATQSEAPLTQAPGDDSEAVPDSNQAGTKTTPLPDKN